MKSENSDEEGKHCFIQCDKVGVHLFCDPLGLRLDAYRKVVKRLTYADNSCEELIKRHLQPPTTNICVLDCSYIANHVFSGYYPVKPLYDDKRVLGSVKHLKTLYLSSHTLSSTSLQFFFSIQDETKVKTSTSLFMVTQPEKKILNNRAAC